MALVLPRVQIDRDRRFFTESRKNVLSKTERKLIMAVDKRLIDTGQIPGDRVLPLDDGRFAVGRGSARHTIWRVIAGDDLAQLAHPAELWSDDAWFDPLEPEEGEAPQMPDLAALIENGMRLTGSSRKLCELLAAAVAHLRRDDDKPLAIVGKETVLRAPRFMGRWFVLALLAAVPNSRTKNLRIGCYEPDPYYGHWDVVLCSEAPKGFEILEASKPPDVKDDLLAWYLKNLLVQGQTKKVEDLARASDTASPEAWAAALERAVASDGAARAGVSARMLKEDKGLADKLVTTRIKGGAKVDKQLAAEIAAVTSEGGLPDMWRHLVGRPQPERLRALQAWLKKTPTTDPSDALLDAIGAIRPPGAHTEPWISRLLQWFHEGKAAGAAASLLEQALLEPEEKLDLATRAAIWMELLVGMVEQKRGLEAIAALFSPLADEFVAHGLSRALAQGWLLLDDADRNDAAFRDLMRLFEDAPDGDQAALALWLGLRNQGARGEADAVVRSRAALAGRHGAPPDALVARLIASNELETWVRGLASALSPDDAVEQLGEVIPSLRTDLWLLAETASAEAAKRTGRDRLVAMVPFLKRARGMLVPIAYAELVRAVPRLDFPDDVLADAARIVAEQPRSTSIWMWLAISAATPGHFEASTIDATVHAFCQAPPLGQEERELGIAFAELLGKASAWGPVDQARWFVRLVLAPDGDDTHYGVDLAIALGTAISRRRDGVARLAQIFNALLELPEKHPTHDFFIDRLMPALWHGKPPNDFLKRVDIRRAPASIRQAWKSALGMW